MSPSQPKSPLQHLVDHGQVETRFQPIFDVTYQRPRICFLECLSRGTGSFANQGAPFLFAYARRKGMEPTVDRLCITTAFRTAATLGPVPDIAVNVHAATLSRDTDFVPFLLECTRKAEIPAGNIVLEIVEHAPAWSTGHFPLSLERLRNAGIRIALDDIGSGNSNFRMMLEVEPDFFKLDACFCAGCHSDPKRQAIIASTLLLAERLDAQVVGEGVEDEEDLRILRSLGVQYVQGFLLGAPRSALDTKELLRAGRAA